MIDQLIQASSECNWDLTTKLLYEHWLTNAVECFACREKDPWVTHFDEKKIGKFVLVKKMTYGC